MASEIRANTLKNRVGLGTVSYTNTGIVVSGIVTANSFSGTGDLDVDGHTNLDNVSIAGVTTMSGNLTISNTTPVIKLVDTDSNSDFSIYGSQGVFNIYDETNTASRLTIASDGTITAFQGLVCSGDLTIPDSIIHSGDTNTKIRFPAADQIQLETGGISRLRAENSGVVITGVTTFSAATHVSNANGSVFFGAGNATAYGSQGGIGRASNAGYHISGSAVGDLCIAAEGSKNIIFGTKTGTGIGGILKRLTIDSAGRIGIGEASPGSYSSGAFNLVISSPSGSNSGITINSAQAGTDSGAIFFSHGTASGANGVGRIRYYHSDDHMDFWTASEERLRIDSSGRVIIADGGSGGTADTNADNFVVKNYTSSGSCGISILNSDSQNSVLYFGNASDTKHAEVVWSDASNLFLIGSSNAGASIKLRSADQSDAVIIDSSQRVGVGTMSPDTLVEIGNAIGTGTANLLKLTSYTNSQSSRPALVFWNNNPNTAQAQISAKGGASYNASKLHFSVANSSRALQDRACIDEFGTFIIGPGETRRNTKGSNQHQVLLIEGTGNNSTRMSMIRNSNDDNGPEIQLIKTRGTSIGSVTKPNQNDYIGSLVFIGGDDSDLYARGADISVQATGTPANDRIPSDIIFSTTPTSGATSPQEAVRITSEGRVGIDKPTNVAAKLNIGDTGNDGALSQLIKLGNDSSGAGTGSQINLGLVHGNESTSACIAGFLDSGGGTSFIVKTAGTYANQSTVTQRLLINSGGQLIHNANKASGYVAEFHQDHASNSAQILIDSPTNSASRPAFIELSRAGTLQWSFGQGYNNSVGAFHFATSTLGSGVTGSKFSIEADGDIAIPTVGAKIYTNNSGGNLTIQGGASYPGSAIKFNGGTNGGTGNMHLYAGQTTSLQERMTIAASGRIGMSQSSPDAATLHIGNSYASTSSNVALQVGTITGQNRYLAINHFNNQQNFYQMKMRVNDNQMVPMLDLGNPYGTANHGTAINFHGYQDSKVGAIESENTATNSTSSVDMVLRTGSGPKEVLRLQSNGDARFYNGLFIAKVDNDNSNFSRSGFFLGNPAISEFVYTWSGHSSYTIDLTCASYFSCTWEYFQHQTNGGSRMQQYARGKWSNNHYQHTLNVWEWSGSGGGLSVSFTASDQSGAGSINGLSNMSNNGSTYSGFTNGGGESNSTTANGRFRISETYNWGSVSSRALIVRVSYGSFNISKS